MSTDDRGKESVWDYPRPPRVEPVVARVVVVLAGVRVADSRRASRVLETSHPPTIYVPRADVVEAHVRAAAGASYCEWKGSASYWDVIVGERVAARAAWSYEHPTDAFEVIRGHLAFYPGRVDECWIGDERATAQEGDFYGGWITSAIVGPFKGGRGTSGW